MTPEQLQQLQQINAQLSIQVWVIGGLCALLLALIAYFSRSAFEGINRMLRDHDVAIASLVTDVAVIKSNGDTGKHFNEAAEKISDAMDRNGDRIVSKIRAITPNGAD